MGLLSKPKVCVVYKYRVWEYGDYLLLVAAEYEEVSDQPCCGADLEDVESLE